MVSLIKHHFKTVDLPSYIIIPILLSFFYVAHIPPMFLYGVTVISIPIIIYLLNNKNKVDRFLISLPVEKKSIIKSRYLFSVMMATIILLFQLAVMFVHSLLFGGTQYVYDWKDICVLLCLAVIVTAIFIPIYHVFRSFILATAIISILFFLGVFFTLPKLINVLEMKDVIIFNDLDPGLSMLVEKYIPYQPYALLIMISVAVFYISMIISQRLYERKDY